MRCWLPMACAGIIEEELAGRRRPAMMAAMEGGMPLQEVVERMGANRNALYCTLEKRFSGRVTKRSLTPANPSSFQRQANGRTGGRCTYRGESRETG
ncbi:MAG: hypothetical protein R6W76_13425 [Caldilinea sp.]